MMRHLGLILAAFALLAGCGLRLPGSGGARPASPAVAVAPQVDPVLPPREISIEPGLRGAIVRVEAVAPTQGWSDATLAPLDGFPPDTGMRAFVFSATPPQTLQAVGRERTRLLSAAVFLSNREIAALREIRVNGAVLPLPSGR